MKLKARVRAHEPALRGSERQAHERVLEIQDEGGQHLALAPSRLQLSEIPAMVDPPWQDLALRQKNGVVDQARTKILDQAVLDLAVRL